MKTYNLKTQFKQILADTITPVSIYLKIRDKFPNSLLLESSDYHANDNSFSYICCNPIASIKIENEKDQLIHILAIDSTDDQKQNYNRKPYRKAQSKFKNKVNR